MKRFLSIALVVLAFVATAPRQIGAAPPTGFTLSPSTLSFSTAVDTLQFQFVTVTTHRRLVITNPATITGDTTRTDGFVIFGDTQAGSCWQQYESLGNPIPANTTCTIQVGFYPEEAKTYNATLTVSRCTHWTTDPNFNFVVCTAFDGSESISLTGTGS